MPRKLIALLLPVLTAGLVIVPPPRLRVASAVRLCASESSFDEIFAQGTAYVQSGDLDLALGNFKRCAKLDPSHAPTQQLIEKLSALEVDEAEDDAPEEPEEPEEPEGQAEEEPAQEDAADAEAEAEAAAESAAEEDDEEDDEEDGKPTLDQLLLGPVRTQIKSVEAGMKAVMARREVNLHDKLDKLEAKLVSGADE